jgi:NADPH:quinone reductase
MSRSAWVSILCRPGVTDIPGLDIAGVVERTGDAVRNWRAGDRVCA